MIDNTNLHEPAPLAALMQDTQRIGFGMASEPLVGALLRTLAAAKPGGRFLELGTGTGLSTAWLLQGMDGNATLLTVDNDPAALAVAKSHMGEDLRLKLVCEDGDAFVQRLFATGERFDFIFADTWSGKYRLLNETLSLLKPHGLYVIDDMLPQTNWPDDHPAKVAALLAALDVREDLFVVKQGWSCGVVICTKRPVHQTA